MDTFHTRLEQLLSDAGIPQSRISLRAGLSAATVRNVLDRESPPSLATVQALAGVLGVSVGWLAAGEGDAPDPEAVRSYYDRAPEVAA